jgi:predicted transposase YbfD/YdcC
MGCQTEIAAQIVEQGADYLLAVKANQGHLHEDIEFLFACAQQTEFKGIDSDYAQTVSQGHGRIERRECWIIDDQKQLDFIRDRNKWAELETIVMIRAHRQEGKKVETKDRYFISSLQADAHRLLAAKRSHWGVENELHWTLDVAFREDVHQLGMDPKGFQNPSALSPICYNPLPTKAQHIASLSLSLCLHFRLSFPRRRESTLASQMDTRLRGYDTASGKFKNCKDSAFVPLFLCNKFFTETAPCEFLSPAPAARSAPTWPLLAGARPLRLWRRQTAEHLDHRHRNLAARFEYALPRFFQRHRPRRISVRNLDAVVHLAAHAKVHELVQQPYRALENITMTWNVLEYCRHHNLPIIFSSSREVYGDIHRYITEESYADFAFTESPYSASKISGEALIYSYAQCYKLPYLVFRFQQRLRPL